MNKTFRNIFSVLLISLLAGYAQADSWLLQANIVSSVNPILAVKSIARQNPDKVPAIAASFANRFPDAAPDIAATLAGEFPDQADEIVDAVGAALAGDETAYMLQTVAQAVPKTADEMFAPLTQDVTGEESDIDRTASVTEESSSAFSGGGDIGVVDEQDLVEVPSSAFSGGGDIEVGDDEPDVFPFPILATPPSSRRPTITGGNTTCVEVCESGRNCVSLTDECSRASPDSLTTACNKVVQCAPELCSKVCKNS